MHVNSPVWADKNQQEGDHSFQPVEGIHGSHHLPENFQNYRLGLVCKVHTVSADSSVSITVEIPTLVTPGTQKFSKKIYIFTQKRL